MGLESLLFTTVFSNSFGLQFKSNKSLEFSVSITALFALTYLISSTILRETFSEAIFIFPSQYLPAICKLAELVRWPVSTEECKVYCYEILFFYFKILEQFSNTLISYNKVVVHIFWVHPMMLRGLFLSLLRGWKRVRRGVFSTT